MKVNTLSNIFNLYEKAAPKKKWPLLLTLITLLAAASGRVNGSAFNFPKESVINEHNSFDPPQDEFIYPENDPYEDSGYGLGGMKLKFELLDEMNNAFFMKNSKKINMIQFPANNPIQDRCFVYEIDMSNDVLEPIGSFQRIKDKEDKHFIKAFEKSAIKYVNDIDFPSGHNYYAHMSNTAIERGKGKSTKKGWVHSEITIHGTTNGSSIGFVNGSSNGFIIGSFNGATNGSFNGTTNGATDGSFNGATIGATIGTTQSFAETKATEKTVDPTTDSMDTDDGESLTEEAVEPMDVDPEVNVPEEELVTMDVDAGENLTEEALEPMDVDAGENLTEETAEKVSDETTPDVTDEATESTFDEVIENVELPAGENAEDAAVESAEDAAMESAGEVAAESAGDVAAESAEEVAAESAEAPVAEDAATEASPSTTEAANTEAQTGEGSNTENAADESGKTTDEEAPMDTEEAIAGPSTMEPSDFLNRQEISNNVFERYSQYYDEMKAFNESFLFAAVIDGHGGEVIADIVKRWLGFYVKKQLMEKLRNNDHQILTPSDIVASLEEAHIQLDNDILKKAKEFFFKGNAKYTRNGSCSISLLMDKNYYYVSNIGDSKGLLIKKDSIVRLNNIQNAGELTERMRLVQEHPNEVDVVMCKRSSKNGSSKPLGIFSLTEQHSQFQMFDVGRCYVKGRLQCTRSFGDFYLKHKIFAFDYRKNKFLVKEPHSFPYISAIPEVLKIRRSQDDEFVLLVSDGISDHLSDKEIYDIVKQYSYSVKKMSRILIQTVLIKAAMHVNVSAKEMLTMVPPDRRRKLFDDMSVVVIKLN
ncbi:protein phosphatase 2C domain containing protein [Plasmodium cynomolgi strain B]|uniref:Protein phosphatase 2C domain containing protein n=1 Tax=Plasmodium cynomolgi (strain B) TaxID=1120755 RepID=K6UW94_PLACD|nr:protein phosphatase 2C domain containing protein [Plasmodium cynomolgi strain B]GAB66625.1 protein phosphatase 2C domain containing protein [Plasmodium cynomolgi strain B]